MNADRRKALAKVRVALESAKTELEDVAAQERDAFDNLPESIQASDKGREMEAVADTLDESTQQIEEALAGIDDVINYGHP